MDVIELGYEKPKFELNGLSFDLPLFQYDEKQSLEAKLDFEAKMIFYHILDHDTLNLVSKFDTSNKIWRFLIERYEGHEEQSDKSEKEESTSDEEAFRSCFVAHVDEVASTSFSSYSSSDDDDLGFDIHVEFSSFIEKYKCLRRKIN